MKSETVKNLNRQKIVENCAYELMNTFDCENYPIDEEYCEAVGNRLKEMLKGFNKVDQI